MRKKTIVLTILLAILLVPIFGAGVKMLEFRKYYGEAEPLVQIIWPLANEMESYFSERGTFPESLDDIASFSPDLDLSPLDDYDPVLNTGEDPLFLLRVNDRYSFAISRDFVPSWVTRDQAEQGEALNP